MAALCSWLARRRPAQHAESITLELNLPTGPQREDPAHELSETAFEERECLAACLAAISASAGSRLRALALDADCNLLTTSGWPAGFTTLTQLSLSTSGGLSLGPALRSLRGLKELCIRTTTGVVEGEENLPPCLTRLGWTETAGADLPDSVSERSRPKRSAVGLR